MTAQINDKFRYRNAEYVVAGISEGELFDVSVLDIDPATASTACRRGYQAVFAVDKSRLVLDALHVNLIREGKEYQREQGAEINGVTPSPSREEYDFFFDSLFNNHYEGLNYRLEYSGGLLLADGFIKSLYVHMGFHPAWKYKTVIELIFDAGILKEELDRTDRMADLRKTVLESRGDDDPHWIYGTSNKNEIAQFVERAFDRTYHI